MDDGSPLILSFVLILLLLFSAFFAACESALSSIKPIRLKTKADNGDKRAIRVQKLLENFDTTITAILIWTNVVHISFATIVTLFAGKIWGLKAIPLATAVSTVVIFFFGETIPKCFATKYSNAFAMYSSSLVCFFMAIAAPLVLIFGKIGELMAKPFKRTESEPKMSEDEFSRIMDNIVEGGTLDEDTGKLVSAAMDFDAKKVKEIMTPWDKVVTVKADTDDSKVLEMINQPDTYSRIPVLNEDGEPVALLNTRKFLKYYLRHNGEFPSLGKASTKVHFVDEDMLIDEIQRSLSESRVHFAFVRDAEKHVIGIVTMEDILEELVGEIYDEDDSVENEGEKND